MASQVLTNVKTYLGEYDVTGFTNAVTLDYQAQALKDTRMGHTTEINKGGVKTVAFRMGGFGDPGSAGMEAIAQAKIGTSNLPLTCVPVGGGAVGDVAYFFNALKSSMSTFGQHGELMPFQGNAVGGGESIDKLVRGYVFVSSAVAKTTTAQSAVIELGAVSATQRVYAALHVIDPVTGTLPTLTAAVFSDDLVGFGSGTIRLGFTEATGKTSQFVSAAGPITDTFWRVEWSIGGGSPSFPFIVVVGIL